MISIFQLFAKTDPFVDLFEHCKNTGEAAGVLWDLGVIDKNVINRRDLCLIAALHDLGKCHPVFQRKGLNLVEYIDQLMKECLLPTVDKPNYRHELGTEKALLKRIELFANKDIARAVAKILRLHHQKTDCQKMNCYEEIYPNEKSWLQAQDNLINELQKHFGITLKEIDFIINDANCALVWGIVILADWIVSGGLNDKIGDIFRRKACRLRTLYR
jgi:CRISPR-associated endonuclease Cas3-HD